MFIVLALKARLSFIRKDLPSGGQAWQLQAMQVAVLIDGANMETSPFTAAQTAGAAASNES